MRVLAFGEVMMRLMPNDYKMMDQTDSLEYLYTGTGVNILGGLSRLGVSTSMFTCLPDNRIGKSANAHLRKLGLDTSFVRFDSNHMGMYFLEKGIGARSSYVTYMNRSESSFAKHDYQNIDYDALLDSVSCIHICGISLIQDHTYRVALNLMKEARKREVLVFFDCNYRPSLWDNPDDSLERYLEILSYCDYVFATSRDASRFMDGEGDELMNSFKERFNFKGIFGTKRSTEDTIQGFAYLNSKYESSVYDVVVYDRIGTGDGFALGVIYALLNDYTPNDLIEFSTASGVLAHTTYGDTPCVDLMDIENLVNGIYIDLVR